jgi:hypothetical protein
MLTVELTGIEVRYLPPLEPPENVFLVPAFDPERVSDVARAIARFDDLDSG